jgi:hypothetical protein
MLLPDRERAYVDRTKITDYLLSLSHPDGRSKAEFFSRFGFEVGEWQALADALRAVAQSNPVVQIVESPYGVRYTIDGLLAAPDGRTPRVRTVWIAEPEGAGPRLITAHPLQE